MRAFWMILGAVLGALGGACLGFGLALVVMSFTKNPSDGTYGMREMLVCVPLGAIVGVIAGITWGLTTRLSPT